MSDAQTATAENNYANHSCGRKGKRKWSGLEIVTMVGGFIVFWPVGLLALAFKLIKGEMWPGASEGVYPWASWKSWKKPEEFNFAKNWQRPTPTGNAAFDEYKKTQLDRLETERKKLEEEQQAFADYLTKLRKAKDQDEFDRFMSERNIITPKGE